MLNNSIDNNTLTITGSSAISASNYTTGYIGDYTDSSIDNNGTCWNYWYREYYPQVIRESYPIYIKEKAKDKGKQAFEIIKILSDKKIIRLDTVKNFIDAMDALIKIL